MLVFRLLDCMSCFSRSICGSVKYEQCIWVICLQVIGHRSCPGLKRGHASASSEGCLLGNCCMDTLFGGRQTIDGRAGRSACALPSRPGEPCVAQLVYLFMTLSILMDVLGMYPIWKTARASTGRLPPHSNMSHSSSFPRPFVPFKGTSTNCGISCR